MDTTTTRSEPSPISFVKHLQTTVPKPLLREMLAEMPWSALARKEQLAPEGDWLTWLYLASYVLLLGAEINSELEHQTEHDSTVGPTQPVGARNNAPADDDIPF